MTEGNGNAERFPQREGKYPRVPRPVNPARLYLIQIYTNCKIHKLLTESYLRFDIDVNHPTLRLTATLSTARSAGEMPGMRAAWAMDSGRMRLSFSRDS